MLATYKEYRDSLTRNSSSNERLLVEYKAYKSSFQKNMQKVLQDYGFLERLKLAKSRGEKLRILQTECGEGLYLHDLAAILDKEGVLEAAEIYGVDANPQLIEVARQFQMASNPPRPSLKFYPKDFRKSLTKWAGLISDFEPRFDFIFNMCNLFNAAGAENTVTQVYQENLQPGGICCWFEGQLDKGWSLPHPAFIPMNKAIHVVLASLNPGLNIAQELSNWLGRVGAIDISTFDTIVPLGGSDESGKNMLRNYLIGTQEPAPLLIANGLLTQAEHDEMLRVLYKELTPAHVGQITYITTIARKPLQKSESSFC